MGKNLLSKKSHLLDEMSFLTRDDIRVTDLITDIGFTKVIYNQVIYQLIYVSLLIRRINIL